MLDMMHRAGREDHHRGERHGGAMRPHGLIEDHGKPPLHIHNGISFVHLAISYFL
jgi:hypothetical protein